MNKIDPTAPDGQRVGHDGARRFQAAPRPAGPADGESAHEGAPRREEMVIPSGGDLVLHRWDSLDPARESSEVVDGETGARWLTANGYPDVTRRPGRNTPEPINPVWLVWSLVLLIPSCGFYGAFGDLNWGGPWAGFWVGCTAAIILSLGFARFVGWWAGPDPD